MRTANLIGLLLLIGSACIGCAGPAPSAAFVEQAERLHGSALATETITDPDAHDYVQLVGKRIADAAHAIDPGRTHDSMFSQMQYDLVASSVPNVFATGGPHLYIYDGLLQICQTEDQLAAAIAHAYAHAMNLDIEHVGFTPDNNDSIPMIGWQFVTHRFTLAQEQAADKLAFDLTVQAGYDPGQYVALFEQRTDRYPSGQAADRTPLIVRTQAARQMAQATPRTRRPLPVADPKTFLALRKSVADRMNGSPTLLAYVILRALPNCMLASDLPEQVEAQEKLRPVAPAKRLEPN
jgi:hypothetical protein